MTILIGALVALSGLAALLIGLAVHVVFRIGLRHFDRSMAGNVAAEGREQVERAAMMIRNPLVRRMVLDHMVNAGGTMLVAVVRDWLKSRMRLGALGAVAGLCLVTASPFTSLWLPLIWKA